ncbi:flagellar biosynthesis anti-sigma factor FlgM [Curvibacter sp. APW13]|uniref:flagellar biosynthesis anti-sigma factor FlgM n=1 Tax=Curvibacter sp. APW13 TaxID=3077236 RepID=UPI0028DD9578|nr:flagellar biosynthesis anti-sigma factor FlgM [Curvibacter sp. APW13]MDT8993037.1 flagellar biosynthesis anti-sigma factor FlgM [Curvibacter sp. APW13]
MKIGQPSELPALVTQTQTSGAQKTGAQAPSTPNATATKSARSAGVAVSVSTLARTLDKGEAGDAADVDSAKVEAVKTAIQQGTYTVNAEAIADKLLSNAQEMLNRTMR